MDAEGEKAASGSPGIVESARRLLGTLVAIVQTRVELVATELQEEVARLASIVILSFVTVLLGGIGLGFAGLALLFAVPPERRMLAAAALAAAAIGAAVIAALVARRVQRAKPRPFDATLRELRRDRERLGGER